MPDGAGLEVLVHLELGEVQGLGLPLLETLSVRIGFLLSQLGHEVQLDAGRQV